MPRTNKKEESTSVILERLNPIASLVSLNEKIEIYLERFQGSSKHYTSQKANEYRRLLEAEIIKRKAKISRNNFALTLNNSTPAQIKLTKEKKVDATKEIFSGIKPMATQIGLTAIGPVGAIAAPLIVDKAHEKVQQVKKTVKGVVQFFNEPSIRTSTTKVAAAAGAVVAGGAVAGTLAPIMADAAQSLTQSAINTSFSGITGGSGILGTIISPIIDATSSTLGGVVGTTAAIVLPLALLYIAVPQLYKLFFWGMNKTVDRLTKNRNIFTDLSLLPNQGPLLELICNLSTLSSIKKLDTELRLKGMASVKFNISHIFKKITNPDNEKLSQADEALYQLAKKNAEKLIKLSKKASNKPESLIKYQNLQATKELIRNIKPSIPTATLSQEMLFCFSITGALINDEKLEIQQSFFYALKSALREPVDDSDTYSLDSWTTDHTYESIPSVKSERRYENVASKPMSHTYENTSLKEKVYLRRAKSGTSVSSHYTPLVHSGSVCPSVANLSFFESHPSRRGSATPSQTDTAVSSRRYPPLHQPLT